MVLESLINPKKAERKPWEMFFIGLIYSSVAIMISLWLFKEYISIVMVFFTVILCARIMYGTISLEENKDKSIKRESFLLKEHSKALSFFIFLFLGFVVSFSLWYIFYPDSALMFDVQLKTIGSVIAETPTVSQVFLNNLGVLALCLIFSFIFGIGAIFILVWNASIMGAAIGSFINYTGGLARYLIHGLPEILAYFMAGLGMGIISIAIAKRDFGNKEFKRIIIDSLDLIILSIFVLFLAALLEVYVAPLLF